MSEFAHIPMSPEDQEKLSLDALLVVLQFHKETAIALQENQVDAHIRARQPLKANNYQTFHFNETGSHIPARHTRVVFGPQHKQAARSSVTVLVARFPETEQDFYPANNLGKPWNDVFLEVIQDDGSSQDYLLNSKGLLPFKDAQIDIYGDDDCYDSGDLFTARTNTHFKAPFSIAQLSNLLPMDSIDTESYVYIVQDNAYEIPTTDR